MVALLLAAVALLDASVALVVAVILYFEVAQFSYAKRRLKVHLFKMGKGLAVYSVKVIALSARFCYLHILSR